MSSKLLISFLSVWLQPPRIVSRESLSVSRLTCENLIVHVLIGVKSATSLSERSLTFINALLPGGIFHNRETRRLNKGHEHDSDIQSFQTFGLTVSSLEDSISGRVALLSLMHNIFTGIFFLCSFISFLLSCLCSAPQIQVHHFISANEIEAFGAAPC